MKRLVFDLDGTLALDEPERPYPERRPNAAVIAQLRAYREQGFEIIICSARNMRTHQNSVGKINAHTLPVILEWLARHEVPYDEIHVGKPWCGTDGFYIDDKAVRPSEFVKLSPQEIQALLDAER
ncbi:predicted hydrolase (HAD superfamily) [Phenylobacterium zucineum HLK1]|uniref:Predicted hydrolase (HAD superfamily) n=1 Tax=Phenylobacterium zucineum (strain HLK1) TaxID=450851 RepID=B4R805_PHEZH|nr:HAD hydrolase family protein [Phenylobacterium zucineum]ACG77538.1 predicted hydrolase (HAD superfamily) [Phenylobacterium zucineum HLK1]